MISLMRGNLQKSKKEEHILEEVHSHESHMNDEIKLRAEIGGRKNF